MLSMYLSYVLYVSLFLFLFVLSSGSEGASLMRPSLLLRLVLRVETLLVIFICLKSCTSHTICRYVVVLRASHSVCVRFPPPSPFVDVAPKVS